MEDRLSDERKNSLRELIDMVLEGDVLTLDDEREIVDVCLEASRRAKAEIEEACLEEMVRKSTNPGCK